MTPLGVIWDKMTFVEPGLWSICSAKKGEQELKSCMEAAFVGWFFKCHIQCVRATRQGLAKSFEQRWNNGKVEERAENMWLWVTRVGREPKFRWYYTKITGHKHVGSWRRMYKEAKWCVMMSVCMLEACPCFSWSRNIYWISMWL